MSASRRTDIPAFHMDWLLNRLREGHALVRNPVNPRSITRVDLSREAVDGIVFWTKNPAPLLEHIGALDGWPFYVQFTLTGYGPDLEPRVPDRARRLDTFRALAARIGPDRVTWRYDPIILSPAWPVAFHLETFEALCRELAGSTTRCVISVLDLYAKIRRPMLALGVRAPSEGEAADLARALHTLGAAHEITVSACCEPAFRAAGLPPARCIDASQLARPGEAPPAARRDPGQRPACACDRSVDIGHYGTCPHGCLYCYANPSRGRVLERLGRYDPGAPMLCDAPGPDDRVTQPRPRRASPGQGHLFQD
ncbi:DUF1848 domain-containing protein [Phaeovibrio sulfidiphilus]|uniref:DUF1848 domain-containing protein n=1 Tax=Phaeovibrio sulfidiphilus TaxID=1220600 RepID=UPI003084354D